MQTFATDLLTRAVFFGQTEVNALLEVCDDLSLFAVFSPFRKVVICRGPAHSDWPRRHVPPLVSD